MVLSIDFKNRVVKFEKSTMSFEEIAELYQDITGRSVKVV